MSSPRSEKKPGIFSRIMGAVVGSVIGVVVGAVLGTIRGIGEFAKAGGGMFAGEFAPLGYAGGAILGAAVGAGAGIFFGIRHAIEQGAKNGFAAGCKGGAVGGATWDGPDAISKSKVETEVKQDAKSAAKTEAAPRKPDSSEQNQDRKEMNALINNFSSLSTAYINALKNKDITAEKKQSMRSNALEALAKIDSKASSGGMSSIEDKQVQEMVNKMKKAEQPAAKPTASSSAPVQDNMKKEEAVPESPRMRK